ncbi:WD40/YVTN/BNR-like repeat-containing protein [Planctomycetaceae bacterium SH139]
MLCPAIWHSACGQAVDLPAIEIPASRLDDAGLWDVQFLDPDQGWAVGDLGVILVTRDGGDNWRPQSSGTSASLRAVSFLSPRDGVVVGGWYETDTGLSRGVILRTRDGGASWESVPSDLPALTAFTRLPGGVWIASGDWSSIHLGRLFVSEDQGLSWRVIDGDQSFPATALSLNSAGVTLCDHQGVLFQFDLANWQLAALSAPGPCSLLHVHADTAIAALQSGGLLVSRNGGQRWTPLNPAPPVDAERFPAGRELASRGGSDEADFDISRFQALCATTSKDGTIWIAGRAGQLSVGGGSQWQEKLASDGH